MEIRLATVKKVLAALLVVFVALAVGRAAITGGLPWLKPTPTPEPTRVPDGRDAAMNGLAAFLSIDVTQGKDAWRERFCSLATENGCAMAELFIVQNWDTVTVPNKIRTVFEPQDAVLYHDFGDGRQVWDVKGIGRDLNKGTEAETGGKVMVVLDNGVWKFDHPLFQGEIEAIEKLKQEGGQ